MQKIKTLPENPLFNINPDRLSNIDRKKQCNKLKIIRFIYKHGPSSIAEFSAAVNISAPTCLIIVAEMVAEEILERNGKGESIGGRRPDLFTLKRGGFYVLSFSMERFATHVAIVDNNNIIIAAETTPIKIDRGLSSIDNLVLTGMNLIAKHKLPIHKFIGVGFAMPGLINVETGRNETYLLTGDQVSLVDYLKGKFNLPVFIDNDVKSAAAAELNHGLAKGMKDALVVLMDWGIGLGVIMDGEVRRGGIGFSGEIGHIPFIENGALCYCGKHGCLETVSSGIALTRLAREGIENGHSTLLKDLCHQDLSKLDPALIILAANQGDLFSIRLLSDIGYNLGKCIATLIQVLNPQVIILAGKIAGAKQYITLPIIQSINTYSMMEIRRGTNVLLSELGADSSLLGVAHMVAVGMLNYWIDILDN